MRRISIILSCTAVITALSVSCSEDVLKHRTSKDGIPMLGKEYILFQDTLSTHLVLDEEGYSFSVPIASTVACDYDRTIAVEIIDKGSNAIEGLDYTLKSNTVTIPAGETATNVEVVPVFDRLGDTDTLTFNLKLVMPDQLRWDLYGDQTKIQMVKSCTFDINDFTGYCVVTSLFLFSYPGEENEDSYQRLIKTRADDTAENTVILEDWLFDGYDVSITFDSSDPENPLVHMESGQILSDEMSVFNTVHGDNRILVEDSPNAASYFNSCQKFVSLWTHVYVNVLNERYGTVGQYYHLLEWVSDEEGERLENEGF